MIDSQRGRRQLWGLGQLLLLGALVGLACWPLNLVDHWQDRLLAHLPRFRGGSWSVHGLLIATAPLLVVPLLLWLQRGVLASGAGSGIPQTIASLERPEDAEELLNLKPTLARLSLWTVASLALLPLGREGPVVHVGAAVAEVLGRRHRQQGQPASAPPAALLAVGAGAGLAGGFNSPLMGALFVMEELTGRFSTGLIWPALVACSAAALVSNLAGIPLFPLGMVPTEVAEWTQLLWAVPVGLGGGLLGGLFARLLLICGRWLGLRVMRDPIRWGLLLGAALALLALLSGGGSGGDGEALMQQLLAQGRSLPIPGSPLSIADWLLLLLNRIVAPVLALSAGIPGGLIDPAFTIGALFGAGSLELLGGDSQLGVALGMAAGLAGATQLPLMTLVFALRMAGDQQWLFGILLSAVLGAYAGRRLQPAPIYHALAAILMEQRQALRAGLQPQSGQQESRHQKAPGEEEP